MYWSHRILQRLEGEGTAYEETFLYIVEVYHNDEDGSIIGWTEKEYVYGESLDELRQSLHWMLDALDKPILIESDLLQRAEEVEAMGGDVHDIGIPETGEISLGLDEQLSLWDDDGGK